MHEVRVKEILSSKNRMNIYRGCSHGCIYCDSRSRCYHMDHRFEDIQVKKNALELLEEALKKRRKKSMIITGAMSDPYIPLERERGMTRKALELIEKYGFGVSIISKSSEILRDLDLLDRINKKTKVVVQMTMTTYSEDLCKIIEPAVSSTKERYQVLKTLQAYNIPTIVWLSPILPYINDSEENLRGLLDYCIDAGVRGIICFGMGVTLRDGNREYFYKNLDKRFPGLKEKYIEDFGTSYMALSKNNDKLMKIFKETCQKHNIVYGLEDNFKYIEEFKENSYDQLSFL